MRGCATLSPERPSGPTSAPGTGRLGTPPCETLTCATRPSFAIYPDLPLAVRRPDAPHRHAAPEFARRDVAIDERHGRHGGPFAHDDARQQRAVRADGRAALDHDGPDAVLVRHVLVAKDGRV